jgi:hypothetical protein
MFNLHSWIKSWFNSDKSVKTASHYNIHLENARKENGETSEDQPMIVEKVLDRKDSDSSNSIIQKHIGEKENIDDRIAEARLEDAVSISKRKEEDHREEVPRMSVASEKYDHEYREAYAKAEKEMKKQKDLFEKYMGKKSSKKVPSNVPDSASGLVNSPERFVNFDGIPDVDVKKNLKNIEERSSVKPMHTTGDLEKLKQLDAAAYHISFKAASLNREMNEEEIDLIGKIIDKKREIIKLK